MATKVAIQGECGSFSHEAASEFFKENFEIEACEDVNQVLDSINSGKSNFGILPIESSKTGLFPNVYEALLKLPKLQILAEFVKHESFALIGNPGSTIEGANEIISHPFVIDQCTDSLHKLGFSSKQFVGVYDSAGSCLKIKGNSKALTLANSKAAKLHDLVVLKEKMEDDPATITRYIVIGNPDNRDVIEKRASFGGQKTTIVFCLKNESGAFFRAVGCFSLRNINISKVEMCPSRRCSPTARVWEYVTFMELDDSVSSINLKKAIANLEEFSTFVRVLGSYKNVKVDNYDPTIIHGFT
mmetsp:Transcript_10864/g.27461  ORF Transcript_10864/g.27461 Transcript_10864/m.27461 type:complete len:300 (+) Transcript_10864:65-964(+)